MLLARHVPLTFCVQTVTPLAVLPPLPRAQGPSNVPPTARQLLPGDALVTSCTYSGVGRTNVTYEGLASYEEMVGGTGWACMWSG